jgi:hypothetical protein
MPVTLNVNNKTVVHAGSTGTSTAAPDPCKTPTPGGPVPMPYPNVAMSSDASQVSTTVKVDGNGIMVDGSKFAMSTGDEAGSALGVTSNKIKGPAEFKNYSTDVKFDGKAVARLSDPMGQNQGTDNAAGPSEMQGPLVTQEGQEAESQEEACKELEKKRVGRNAKNQEERIQAHEEAAKAAGMLPEDYTSFRMTCQREQATVAFRDTNPACTPHLEAGVPSKGHDVTTKTFPEQNLAPEDRDLAGLVSTLDKEEMDAIKKSGSVIPNARSRVHPPPTTGDYDMFDMLYSDNTRIKGESPSDFALRDSLNSNMPNGGNPPRIMHGAQAAYPDYKEQHPGEQPMTFDQEKTLTVFDKSGEVYRLESPQDIDNFYKCKGVENPNPPA